MKDFLKTQLNTSMRLIVGLNVREGELTVVNGKIAILHAGTKDIAIRIDAIDIAEAV